MVAALISIEKTFDEFKWNGIVHWLFQILGFESANFTDLSSYSFNGEARIWNINYFKSTQPFCFLNAIVRSKPEAKYYQIFGKWTIFRGIQFPKELFKYYERFLRIYAVYWAPAVEITVRKLYLLFCFIFLRLLIETINLLKCVDISDSQTNYF